MLKSLVWQVLGGLLVVLFAGVLAGSRGAISAGLGVVSCVLPNAMFVLRLTSLKGRPGSSYPAHFFLGEFVKVLATAGLLAVSIVGYPDMHWLSLLAGWVVALQAGFFAFWKKSDHVS